MMKSALDVPPERQADLFATFETTDTIRPSANAGASRRTSHGAHGRAQRPSLADMADILDRSDDYRVLRHLKPRQMMPLVWPAASGIMATQFAMAATVSSWLEGRGVEASEARGYVGRILSGLARTADGAATTGYPELVVHHETRGRLNEQLRMHMVERGEFDVLGEGLDALYLRIRGGTASKG